MPDSDDRLDTARGERQQQNQEGDDSPSISKTPNPSQPIRIPSQPAESPPTSTTSQETPTSTEPEKKKKFTLIQSDLAKRLDTTPSTIGRRKTDASFAEWSQSKDPDGIAWKYLRRSKVFIPVDPEKRQL